MSSLLLNKENTGTSAGPSSSPPLSARTRRASRKRKPSEASNSGDNSNKTNTSKKQLTLSTAEALLHKIGLSLRTHQLEGIERILSWHQLGHGGILADEMGLGKTCQAIVAGAILADQIGPKMRMLVICPLSVIDHWEYEVKRFSCGRLKVFRYYAPKENRQEMRNKTLKETDWNLLLTTFETFHADSGLLRNYNWDIGVFDEAHRVKSDLTQLHQALANSRIDFLLLMTGTPIQNNMPELYSLLKLVDPGRFGADGQQETFVEKYRQLGKDEQVSKEFRELFDSYCLRRNKKILSDVPKCSEVILYHGISKIQYDLYRAILANNREFFYKTMGATSKDANQSLLSPLTQLRKCCDHPYLFPGIEPQPFEEGEHLVTNSGKALILDRLLEYLHKRGHRVLIFSQFVRYLDIVHDIMLFRGYICEQLDGGVKSNERLRMIENFQRPGSDVFAMLLSTKAGGLGLNLTAADTAIFLDWDFNPQNDKQAAARCHRIGQDKPVKIIRLVAKHTVEELIKYRAFKKLKLSELVLGTDENEGPKSQVDFSNLLLEGLKELEEDQQSETQFHVLTNDQLEEKIGRTTRKGLWQIEDEPMENEVHLMGDDDDEVDEAPQMYVFEGRDYTEDRQALERFVQQQNIGERARRTGAQAQASSAISDVLNIGQRKTRRPLTDAEWTERLRKREEKARQDRERQKAQAAERKRVLWESNNYQSTNLPLPPADETTLPASNLPPATLYDVQGDVTKPVRAPNDRSGHALILQMVDMGGHFGVGGVFSVLRALSDEVPKRYELAAKVQDLHRSDVHLVDAFFEQSETKPMEELSENFGQRDGEAISRKMSVLLMVAQTVRDRYTKHICLPALERCLRRVQHYALQHAATSVHLPQIWFGIQDLDEPTVRSLLNRHFCAKGINAYIYSFRRSGGKRRPTGGVAPKQPPPSLQSSHPLPSPPSNRTLPRKKKGLLYLRPKELIPHTDTELRNKRARTDEEEDEKMKDEEIEDEEDDEEEDYVPSDSEEEERDLMEAMEDKEEEEEDADEEEMEDEEEEEAVFGDGRKKHRRRMMMRKEEKDENAEKKKWKKQEDEGGRKSSSSPIAEDEKIKEEKDADENEEKLKKK